MLIKDLQPRLCGSNLIFLLRVSWSNNVRVGEYLILYLYFQNIRFNFVT